MAEYSRFWPTNGTGDGPAGGYSAAQFYDVFRYLFSGGYGGLDTNYGGVIPGQSSTALKVTGSTSPVNIASGRGIVYGMYYELQGNTTLAISSPVVGTTGFIVVMRASWAAQTIRLAVVKNTDGNSAPPAPTLNPGTTWEHVLAEGTITTGGIIALTDRRVFTLLEGPYLSMEWRGGSGNLDWTLPHATTKTQTKHVRFQCGAITYPNAAANLTVTYPTPFNSGSKPLVFIYVPSGANTFQLAVNTSQIGATTFRIDPYNGTPNADILVFWFAIGDVAGS